MKINMINLIFRCMLFCAYSVVGNSCERGDKAVDNRSSEEKNEIEDNREDINGNSGDVSGESPTCGASFSLVANNGRSYRIESVNESVSTNGETKIPEYQIFSMEKYKDFYLDKAKNPQARVTSIHSKVTKLENGKVNISFQNLARDMNSYDIYWMPFDVKFISPPTWYEASMVPFYSGRFEDGSLEYKVQHSFDLEHLPLIAIRIKTDSRVEYFEFIDLR